jgi:atypical dual specificity phosphatase
VADFGFHYLHVPIPDFEPPTMDDARRFLEFTRAQRAANRAIAVHCRAGYGRTGTLLACYLVDKGRTAAQAINEVRRLRPGSIESAEQERFVERFAREKR